MKLKILGKYVIIKCVLKKSPIILDTSEKNPRMLDKTEVYEAGEETKFKKGQEVRIDMFWVSQTSRLFNPFPSFGEIPKDGEYYIWLKEEEVIGVFE